MVAEEKRFLHAAGEIAAPSAAGSDPFQARIVEQVESGVLQTARKEESAF